MSDISTVVKAYYDNAAEPVTAAEVLNGMPMRVERPRRRPTWMLAIGVAVVVIVVIGGASILLGGSDGSIVPLPPSEVSTTTVPVTTVDQAGGVGVDAVEDIAITDDGTLYALTADGLAVWDTRTGEFGGPVPLTGLSEAVVAGGVPRALEIHHIEVGYNGTLYAAGTADIASSLDSVYEVPPRLIGWVAQFDGSEWSIPVASARAYETEMPVFSVVTGLATGPEWPSPETTKESDAVSVWVLSGDRLVFLDANGWWNYEVPVDTPSSIDVGSNGEVWLGSEHGEGPWHFRGGVWPWQRVFSDTPGEGDVILPSMYTHQVAVASDGVVWMATQDRSGIIALDPDDRVTVYTRADGLLSSLGSVVVGDNHVAVVHDQGISRFNGNSWDHVRIDLDDAHTSQAVLDDDGVLWIPTPTSGILRIEDATLSRLIADPGEG